MRLLHIRNATMKIRYGVLTILLDPWLQDKGAGFSAPTVDPGMENIRNPMNELPLSPEMILAGVDFCLVTHLHPDHFTADYLPKGMKILVRNGEERDRLIQMGF